MLLIISRGKEIKLRLPNATIKSDGTIWMGGSPMLGITDDTIKKEAVKSVKAGKFSAIESKYYTRLGYNENGLWAGTPEDWDKTPEGLEASADLAKKIEEEKNIVKIYLSSRGWGDYSPCEWRGDITRPTTEILAECQTLLENGYDVDKPNQTDDELVATITSAREKWEGKPAREAAARKAEKEDIEGKISTGYCFNCESWCHGDCGNYSTDPQKRYTREMKEAQREALYGINEG